MRLDLFLTAIRVPLDYVMVVFAAISAWSLRFAEPILEIRAVTFSLDFTTYLDIVLYAALGWIIIFALSGLYSIERNKKFAEEFKKVILGSFTSFAVIAIVIFFRGEIFHSRFLVFGAFVLSIVYVLVGRLLLRVIRVWLYNVGIGTRGVLVIGNSPTANALTQILGNVPGFGYNVIKQIDSLTPQHIKSLKTLIAKHAIEQVLLLKPLLNEKEADEVLAFCEEHHLVLKFTPDMFASYRRQTGIDTVAGIPLVELKRTRLEGWGKIIKRLVDIIGGMLLLAFSTPLLLLAGFLVLFESGRPIIFKNKRVGERGKEFNTLKIRSMYQKDSIGEQFPNQKAALKKEAKLIKTKNTKSGPLYKIEGDPRVTPFGVWLRRWSVDELPQFINVIRGDMSLVGPRPHQPREVAQYKLHHKKAHAIKPGITGLAQISGRSDLPFEEENRLDIFYIEHWSLLLDLAIIIKTPWAILRRRKAL